MERVLRHRDSFVVGSSLKAWAFRILRNKFTDDVRAGRRLVEDADGQSAAKLVSAPEQLWRLQYGDMLSAIDRLPPQTREAVVLVIGAGLTHEEAASACGCPLGTLKSRVRRARVELAASVEVDLRVSKSDRRPVRQNAK